MSHGERGLIGVYNGSSHLHGKSPHILTPVSTCPFYRRITDILGTVLLLQLPARCTKQNKKPGCSCWIEACDHNRPGSFSEKFTYTGVGYKKPGACQLSAPNPVSSTCVQRLHAPRVTYYCCWVVFVFCNLRKQWKIQAFIIASFLQPRLTGRTRWVSPSVRLSVSLCVCCVCLNLDKSFPSSL